MKKLKTIISIGDRETMQEVFHGECDLNATEAQKLAAKIAISAGYNDFLRYSVWTGSRQAYEKYRRA